ncbi:flagellar hook-basal body protein [Faecalimicrobium sp. JNUCC 81]
MLRSMYSGISGMKANQTKMDVVGNNVANVGTTAFKKSGTRFTDALNQTVLYASAPGGGVGGVNPSQVGIGAKVSGIFKSMKQGSLQPTGRPTDLAIDGDGFFIVETAPGQKGYTRDGSFSLDMNGLLVTSEGYKVLDKDGKAIEIPKEMTAGGVKKKVLSFNFSKEGKLSYLLEDGTKMPELKPDGTPVDPTKQQVVGVATFQNAEGLELLGGNIYGVSANSGAPVVNKVFGHVTQGSVEMSNVDLSEEFTEMIVTTRAFQAASKVITTSDELLQEIINLKR